jgi:hypothetical protein
MLKNGCPARLTLIDRIDLRMATTREVDGLSLSAFTNRNEVALQRVEDALQLTKRHGRLHYRRVIRSLDRIWVNLTPGSRGNYLRRLNACQLDERFVLGEQTTIDQIASVIVHEATHAVLDRCGIAYDEPQRHRIEAICIRRQLHFVSGLTGCEAEKESVRASLDYYSNNPEFFSNPNMQRRFFDGSLEILQWLGAPNWLVALIAGAANLSLRIGAWRAASASRHPVIARSKATKQSIAPQAD